MIHKIIQWFKRNACKGCNYYCPENNVCRSKKCATCGCHPYTNWFDRHFCKPYHTQGFHADIISVDEFVIPKESEDKK